MARAQLREVPPVDRRELRLGDSLRDGEHGRVDEADVVIGVAVSELADAPVVGGRQVLDDEGAGVAAVERGVEGSRVEDQRQGRGSGRSSEAVRAVSWRPEAPMPRERGLGRCVASFSSSASRTNYAIDTRRSAAATRSRSRRGPGIDNVVRFTTSR